MENSSKAKEKDEDRTNFNNSYATIKGKIALANNVTEGQVSNTSNADTSTLTYESKNMFLH